MATTTADLNGLFKQVYGDEIVNLIPEGLHLIRDVAFATPSRRLGDKFHQPVIVAQEHGVTYAAPNSGAFALNGAISMKTQDAQVDAYQITLRSVMDYESAARAQNGGTSAFRDATELQMENMMESVSKRVELASLYGQSGLAEGDSSVNVDATSTTVTFTTASWATGIWSGAENAQVQFWTAANALVSSGADSIFTVDTVNPDTRSIVFTGTATGIAALDVALGAGNCDVFWYGARTGASTYQEMSGIDTIITNTGTLFNISAADYSLWKGNSYAAAGALTFAKLQSAVAKAVGRGLTEDVTVYVNPVTWGNLLSDQAALRRYDGSYSQAKVDNGMKSIKFYGQNGSMDIVSHIFVKEGEAFAVPVKRMKRLGSQDISFNTPGSTEGEIFRQLENSAGFEYRVYTAQSIFCETPARTVKITGIVNT